MSDEPSADNLVVKSQTHVEFADVAQRLNEACFCVTLSRKALRDALDTAVGSVGFASALIQSHPSLFSSVPVFMDPDTITAMTRVVAAVEAAATLSAYRDTALAWAAPTAAADFGPVGALMGYDFHITPLGPRLIEINTNAGGAFLNSVLGDAQRVLICPLLSGPKYLLFWIMKEIGNAVQEAQAGGDHWQAA